MVFAVFALISIASSININFSIISSSIFVCREPAPFRNDRAPERDLYRANLCPDQLLVPLRYDPCHGERRTHRLPGNHPECHSEPIGRRTGECVHMIVPGKDRAEIGGKRGIIDLAVQSPGVLAEYSVFRARKLRNRPTHDCQVFSGSAGRPIVSPGRIRLTTKAPLV